MWVCSRLLSCWLRVLIERRVCIIIVVEWHKSCWKHVPKIVRVQKDITAKLLINRTVKLIVAANALGFFTGSGIVILLSLDSSDVCRSFRVESHTTIKIYMRYDVLLINEVHNVIERYNLFESLTTFCYKINFWTQNRKNCKLCRIMRSDLGFIVT